MCGCLDTHTPLLILFCQIHKKTTRIRQKFSIQHHPQEVRAYVNQSSQSSTNPKKWGFMSTKVLNPTPSPKMEGFCQPKFSIQRHPQEVRVYVNQSSQSSTIPKKWGSMPTKVLNPAPFPRSEGICQPKFSIQHHPQKGMVYGNQSSQYSTNPNKWGFMSTKVLNPTPSPRSDCFCQPKFSINLVSTGLNPTVHCHHKSAYYSMTKHHYTVSHKLSINFKN